MSAEPVLRIRGLRVELRSGADIVDDIALDVRAGEVLALVGESGSGKTTVAQALLGYARPGARIAAGTVSVAGREVLGLAPAERQAVRGGLVGYIPQDPAAALNPALRVGLQLDETLRVHRRELDAAGRRERVLEVLGQVALPQETAFLRRYPHQLSGGQQQRIAIAMAFAPGPAAIVADEPTTGLDVTTQAHVLDTIRRLVEISGVAMLYVSHDLAVVSDTATHVAVMYAGRIVEQGARGVLFRRPRHVYTLRLMRAAPSIEGSRALAGIPGRAPVPGRRPEGCPYSPRCELVVDVCRAVFPPERTFDAGHTVRCHRAEDVPEVGEPEARPPAGAAAAAPLLSARGVRAGYGDREVLRGVDLELLRGECLALVGESGSGKTTLARCLVGLQRGFTGELTLLGESLPHEARRRPQTARKEIQYIFQSPYGSLNPRRTVGAALARQSRLLLSVDEREARRRAADQLERVGLSSELAERYPDELSGGERQRVSIARALAAEPSLLICDEITSALDVSVQASIVGLLEDLRRSAGLTLLFVTHNLALIRTIADRVAVMHEGRVVESGPLERVFRTPQAAYTRRLLDNAPSMEPGAEPVATHARRP